MLQKHFSKNRGLVFSYPSWPPQFSETLSFLRIFSLLPSLSCSMKFVCSLPMLKFVCYATNAQFVCYARVLHRFTMSKFSLNVMFHSPAMYHLNVSQYDTRSHYFSLFRHTSVSSTYSCKSVSHAFEFPISGSHTTSALLLHYLCTSV